MFAKSLLLQLLQQPRLIEGLGKVDRFKQTVQESPRTGATRKGMRCERWLTVLRLLAGGINIQPRQQILHQARAVLLQTGIAGHPPEILHLAREVFRRQFGQVWRLRLPGLLVQAFDQRQRNAIYSQLLQTLLQISRIAGLAGLHQIAQRAAV
ncbi:hypothetical protein D3C81_1014100 [compost metagenome]